MRHNSLDQHDFTLPLMQKLWRQSFNHRKRSALQSPEDANSSFTGIVKCMLYKYIHKWISNHTRLYVLCCSLQTFSSSISALGAVLTAQAMPAMQAVRIALLASIAKNFKSCNRKCLFHQIVAHGLLYT